MRQMLLVCFAIACFALPAQSQFLADIESDIITEFGTYYPYFITVEPSVPAYTVQPDLSNLLNLDDFTLTEDQVAILADQQFLFVPKRQGLYTNTDESGSGYLEMYDIYIEAFDTNIPQFITSDAMLHVFHKLFDRSLMKAEETNLSLHVQGISNLLHNYLLTLAADETDSLQHVIYGMLASYFSVGKSLIGYEVSDYGLYGSQAQQELALILQSSGMQTTPLFGAYYEDYTQYAPRGHYTKSSTLERYFRTLNWYGRQTFTLCDDGDQPRVDLTGAALYLAYMKQNDLPSAATWESYDKVVRRISFFVNEADDLTIDDYIEYATEYFGSDIGTLDPASFLTEAVLLDFIDSAKVHLRDPRIETLTPKGMRFFGQSYSPDSDVFSQMVLPAVTSRNMPMGLDVMAALHSAEACTVLAELGETEYPGYTTQLESLQGHFEALPETQWVQNAYWNWLYCLMPLLSEKGEGFPQFMQSSAWQRKELNTALASWAELRHDTMLYMKQAITWGMGPGVAVLNGYVEPNPWLYGRLASLVMLMRQEFSWLEEDQINERLEDFQSMLLTLKDISERELVNGTFTEEDNLFMSTFGESIAKLITFSDSEFPYVYGGMWDNPWNNDDMAVVADVHTDLTTGNCLEEGVGYPFRIVVVCPTSDGSLQLCVGAVFSYYEFAQPAISRLTDEAWITMLTSNNPPQVPSWTADFYEPSCSFVSGYIRHEYTDGYISSVDEAASGPKSYRLRPAYPNPFNASTTVTVELPNASHLQVAVYNVLGQRVFDLVDSDFAAGTHKFSLLSTNLATGIYFVHAIVDGELNQVSKVTLVK